MIRFGLESYRVMSIAVEGHRTHIPWVSPRAATGSSVNTSQVHSHAAIRASAHCVLVTERKRQQESLLSGWRSAEAARGSSAQSMRSFGVDHRTECVVMVFDGGSLSADEVAALTVQPEELHVWAWCTAEEASGLLSPVAGPPAGGRV